MIFIALLARVSAKKFGLHVVCIYHISLRRRLRVKMVAPRESQTGMVTGNVDNKKVLS
jgi:hypothetical protein